MKFSLIVATLNRTKELEVLFESLSSQTYRDFEVIVIDQNDTDNVKQICNHYSAKFNLLYLHCRTKGLSVARNIGLRNVSGKIVCFPDDDCVYQNNTLENLHNLFNSHPNIDIITGATTTIDGSGKYLNVPRSETQIKLCNVFNTAISFTIFVKYKILKDLSFDDQFGVGSKFGAAEETDFLVRLLEKQYIGYYFPSFIIYHPDSNKIFSLQSSYKYALGFGAFHRKHFKILSFKLRFIYYLLVSLLKVLLLISVRKNFFILKGKLIGFVTYKSHE
jgi:glycosyltransferase involved in cell wall biosynthesis